MDRGRTHAAGSPGHQSTGISGGRHTFVALDARGLCDARTTEPAPWPGGPPWSFAPGSDCLARRGVCYLAAHHVPNSSEFGLFLLYLSAGLAWTCFFLVLYIALEPYVRRRWPATLVSWSRLLAGQFRDPLVGRDIMVGCLLGAFATLLMRLEWFVPVWLGEPPAQPLTGPQLQFLGVGAMMTTVSRNLGYALFGAF